MFVGTKYSLLMFLVFLFNVVYTCGCDEKAQKILEQQRLIKEEEERIRREEEERIRKEEEAEQLREEKVLCPYL